MSYSKQTWDTTSYVTPTRMNHIEDGIDTIDGTVSTMSTIVTDVSTTVLTNLEDNYYAHRCGKLVTLFTGITSTVTATEQGWKLLKTLPQELRPSGTRYFLAMDYTAGTQANNYPLDMKLQNDGGLYVYLFTGHLSAQPEFTVTYMV